MPHTDAMIAAVASRELEKVLGPLPKPVVTVVRRWPDALPQYEVGHGARMEELQERVDVLGALHLLGNGYRGVGLPDLIRDRARSGTCSGNRLERSVFPEGEASQVKPRSTEIAPKIHPNRPDRPWDELPLKRVECFARGLRRDFVLNHYMGSEALPVLRGKVAVEGARQIGVEHLCLSGLQKIADTLTKRSDLGHVHRKRSLPRGTCFQQAKGFRILWQRMKQRQVRRNAVESWREMPLTKKLEANLRFVIQRPA